VAIALYKIRMERRNGQLQEGLGYGIYGFSLLTTAPRPVIEDCLPSLKVSIILPALPEYSWQIRGPALRNNDP
jgi:hypothetical protein